MKPIVSLAPQAQGDEVQSLASANRHGKHQVIDTLDESRRIIELAALGKQGLIEQHG